MRYLLLSSLLASGLTALAQVPDYVPTDGLVAWYPFNGDANDESGNGNDGIVNGPISTADHLGADNSALLFDGADDYIEISNTNGISSSQGLTMSIWFHWEGTNGNDVQQYLFLIANNPNGAITISDDGSCGMNVLNCNCADDINLTSQIIANTWYQATMTYSLNDGLLKMYLNGELVNSSVESMYSYYTTNNPADRFGNYHFNSHYFKGKLNDAGLWNRALTEQEVFTLYNAESPITGCTDELACNYNPEANVNDGSCLDCALFEERCGPGTMWDETAQLCVVANPSDTDFDECVSMTDLLDLLSVFGTCNEVPWSCGDPLEYQGYDYETVQIGDQCWFAENLRATHYQNGDELGYSLEGDSWGETGSGAYSIYGEGNGPCDSANPDFNACDASAAEEVYGLLYNGHAAMDERNLCPNHWRVGSDVDWLALKEQLSEEGFSGQEGAALKSSNGWKNDGGGTDLFGFHAVSGGSRNFAAGSFNYAGEFGRYWTSTMSDDGNGWRRSFAYNNSLLERYDGSLNTGSAVRCIQDSE